MGFFKHFFTLNLKLLSVFTSQTISHEKLFLFKNLSRSPAVQRKVTTVRLRAADPFPQRTPRDLQLVPKTQTAKPPNAIEAPEGLFNPRVPVLTRPSSFLTWRARAGRRAGFSSCTVR